MSGSTTLAEQLAQADEKAREVRGLLKDLKVLQQKIREEREALLAERTTMFRDELDAEMRAQIGKLREFFTVAVTDATEAVYERFDRIADTLLRADADTRAAGGPTLEELVPIIVTVCADVKKLKDELGEENASAAATLLTQVLDGGGAGTAALNGSIADSLRKRI